MQTETSESEIEKLGFGDKAKFLKILGHKCLSPIEPQNNCIKSVESFRETESLVLGRDLKHPVDQQNAIENNLKRQMKIGLY